MFITKAGLLEQLAEAYDRGVAAGTDYGDALATHGHDVALGYRVGPEPTTPTNPYK